MDDLVQFWTQFGCGSAETLTDFEIGGTDLKIRGTDIQESGTDLSLSGTDGNGLGTDSNHQVCYQSVPLTGGSRSMNACNLALGAFHVTYTSLIVREFKEKR
jgi:hypothetical protein